MSLQAEKVILFKNKCVFFILINNLFHSWLGVFLLYPKDFNVFRLLLYSFSALCILVLGFLTTLLELLLNGPYESENLSWLKKIALMFA